MQGREEEAVRLMDDGIAADPNDKHARILRAEALLRMGRFDAVGRITTRAGMARSSFIARSGFRSGAARRPPRSGCSSSRSKA